MPILDLDCDQILWYLFFKYLWYRLEQGLSGGKQKILISKNQKKYKKRCRRRCRSKRGMQHWCIPISSVTSLWYCRRL